MTDSDQIVPGQWLHARVYERDCDLSPDGKHFAYYARDHRPHRQFDTWTAVSRLPQFTALALWYSPYSGGGGTFLDRRTLVMVPGELAHGRVPGGWRIISGPAMLQDERRKYVQRAHRQKGWYLELQWRGRTQRVHVQESIADRARHATQLHDWLKRDPEELIDEPRPAITLSLPTCIFDQADRLVYERRGKLWRVDRVHGKLKMKEIADFNAMHPEPAPPDPRLADWA